MRIINRYLIVLNWLPYLTAHFPSQLIPGGEINGLVAGNFALLIICVDHYNYINLNKKMIVTIIFVCFSLIIASRD